MANIAIAILNYNGEGILKPCIESALRQTRKPDEILVVDNHSTDGSLKLIDEYANKHWNVRSYKCPKNYGYIQGVNLCFHEAKSPIVLHISNDVVLSATCLEEMLKYLNHHREIAILQPVIEDTKGRIENYGSRYTGFGFGLANRRVSKKIDFCTMTAFMASKQLMQQSGGFSTEFNPAYYEDLDFFMRYRGRIRYGVCPAALAVHYGSMTFKTYYQKQEIHKLCRQHRQRFIRKYYQGFGRVIRELVSGCIFEASGNSSEWAGLGKST